NQLLVKNSFREIFLEIFVQLLDEIGILWQTSTITPAHEHFISNMIKQKLQLQIEKAQSLDTVRNERVFVLFLPQNEIHELGLMFIHMSLLLNGYSSIYLGQSIPLESLFDFHSLCDKVTYISYFTINPPADEMDDYLDQINSGVLRKNQDELIVLGKKI